MKRIALIKESIFRVHSPSRHAMGKCWFQKQDKSANKNERVNKAKKLEESLVDVTRAAKGISQALSEMGVSAENYCRNINMIHESMKKEAARKERERAILKILERKDHGED